MESQARTRPTRTESRQGPISSTGCCPPFEPTPWHERQLLWQGIPRGSCSLPFSCATQHGLTSHAASPLDRSSAGSAGRAADALRRQLRLGRGSLHRSLPRRTRREDDDPVRALSQRANTHDRLIVARGLRSGFPDLVPYSTNTELPAWLQGGLPAPAQDIYRQAFNHAYYWYASKELAHRIAWAALKKRFQRRRGVWVAKTPAQLRFR